MDSGRKRCSRPATGTGPGRHQRKHEMKKSVAISLPDWADSLLNAGFCAIGDEAQMRLAVDLARQNVNQKTGGPFGAAVFEAASGRLVGIGVNSVERLRNSVIHAEVMALMFAEDATGSFSLQGSGQRPEHVLATSCEPCAMCLGAILWSGVRRVLCGASRDDALEIGFDEGPVFPESYDYMHQRGVKVVRNVLED